MSKHERDVANIRQLAIMGISALYTGDQNPAVQDFIQRGRKILADEFGESTEAGEASIAALEGEMLGYIRDPREAEEVRIRALRHAKRVLVGQKKSPGRDERLRIVNQKLSNL